MAKQKIKVYPGERFGAVSFLTYEMMQQKGIASPRNQTVVLQLGFLLDFNETDYLQETNEIQFEGYNGWTGHISNGKLAKRCNMCERTVIPALKELRDNGIIEREKRGKCFRYRFLTFDPDLEALKNNIEHAKFRTFVMLANNDAPDAEDISDMTTPEEGETVNSEMVSGEKFADNQALVDKKSPVPTGLGTSTGIADPVPNGEGGELKSSQKQENDGSLFLPEPTVSQHSKSREEPKASPKEKHADSSLSEESSSSGVIPSHKPDLKVSPPPAARDVVPNGYVEAAIDQMLPGKRMNAAPTDDGLESFTSAFNDAFDHASGAIITEADATKAAKCKDFLEAMLATAGLEMPPLLLFRKYCLTRTQALIENGEIPEPPKWINYYSDTHTGKSIVEWSVGKAKSEHSANSNYQRTKVRLDQQKEQREAPREIPVETQAFLDKLQGRT